MHYRYVYERYSRYIKNDQLHKDVRYQNMFEKIEWKWSGIH